MSNLQPSAEQQAIIDAVLAGKNVIVDAVSGSGKCLGKGTKILTFSGDVIKVEDVTVGMQLMGDDSKPRTVMQLGNGFGELYTVRGTQMINGKLLELSRYTVNKDHILTLRWDAADASSITYNSKLNIYTVEWFARKQSYSAPLKYCIESFSVVDQMTALQRHKEVSIYPNTLKCGDLVDIEIEAYLKLPPHYKKFLKGTRSEMVQFHGSNDDDEINALLLPPYLLGLWLGNTTQTSNNTACWYSRERLGLLLDEKHIPLAYKCGNVNDRLSLLAGIIETSGRYDSYNNVYKVIIQSERLMDDFLFLCRSLGFSAFKDIDINGDGFFHTTIKCEIPHFNNLVNDIEIISAAKGEWYGFTLANSDVSECNGRFLLDDFTITHNTSLVLLLAKMALDRYNFQVTYNSALKLEVRDKVEELKLQNLEVHSYHSTAVRYYDSSAITDLQLQKIIDVDKSARKLPHVDTQIIDECQDMKLTYRQLMQKFLKDLAQQGSQPNILVLGDRYQAVYTFMGSDERYLTLGPALWSENKRETVELPLSMSYRITHQIADFVNLLMLGYNRMRACKDGPKVDYIRQPVFAAVKTVGNKLLNLIRNKSVKPEDIFILAPTLRGTTTPVRQLENFLVNAGVPVYVPTNDDAKLNEEVIQGKTVFCTFHSVKGRERKYVVVWGFDISYFQFFAKEFPPDKCPPTLYVAVTRASYHLTVIEDTGRVGVSAPLPFLKLLQLKKDSHFINLIGAPPIQRISEVIPSCKPTKTSPSEIVKYLQDRFITPLSALVEQCFVIIAKPEIEIEIANHIETQHVNVNESGERTLVITEEVSDINGTIIPAMLEAKLNLRVDKSGNSLTSLHKIIREFSTIDHETKVMQQQIHQIKFPCTNVAEYLHLGTIYLALNSGYHFKLAQIQSYDWLDQDQVDLCHSNMEKYIKATNDDTRFEFAIDSYCHTCEHGLIMFENPRVDCIDEKVLWEFKCTEKLQLEHLLQLVVYAWLWEKCMKDDYGFRQYRIMNIRTGEVRELQFQASTVERIMFLLFENRFRRLAEVNDTDFIKAAKQELPTKSTSCEKEEEEEKATTKVKKPTTTRKRKK